MPGEPNEKAAMSDANADTLRAYSRRAQAYIDGTAQELSGPSRDWIDAALAGLKPDARIVEIGSAFGRDAAYIQSRGFAVECTDAAEGFLDALRARGFNTRQFNLLQDEFDADYELILANAVLLHFNRAECAAALAKARRALKAGGRFAFSLKAGEGEEWSDAKIGAPRYFCYWRAAELPSALSAAGFESWDVVEARTSRAHADWLYVIARARAQGGAHPGD
jgi:SAM-dependent methyltransferase